MDGVEPLEFSFAVKDAEGNVAKFGVTFGENGHVRIRTSDKIKTADHLMQWADGQWHRVAESTDLSIGIPIEVLNTPS